MLLKVFFTFNNLWVAVSEVKNTTPSRNQLLL